MQEHWSSATFCTNIPRQKNVLCVWSKIHILHFYFVRQKCLCSKCMQLKHTGWYSSIKQCMPFVWYGKVCNKVKFWCSLNLFLVGLKGWKPRMTQEKASPRNLHPLRSCGHKQERSWSLIFDAGGKCSTHRELARSSMGWQPYSLTVL